MGGGLTSDIASVAAGFRHTRVVTTGGGVKCWGVNDGGQPGDGTRREPIAPVDVVGLTSGIAVVLAGGSHTCALTTDEGVKCWGDNGYGELVNGTAADRYNPVDLVGPTSDVDLLF